METTSRYTSRPGAHYAYPQPPPSPPMDDTPKCSLPSISNLLVMADQGSPTTDHPPHSHAHASYIKPDTRPSSSRSSHYGSHGPSRASFPPTPPMSSDTSFEAHHSPSAKSVGQASLASTSSYYYETTPPAEDVHRHQPSSYSSSPYYPSSAPSASGLMYQKPLPQNYQPAPPTAVPAPAPSSGANPWQHHHYISPSSAASFPQSQDRYICQTCNKAFSRPSSLRIHSHSHTGEKPFKCPHLGCGKAFSVRSNMKRHERGCHSLENGVHSFR